MEEACKVHRAAVEAHYARVKLPTDAVSEASLKQKFLEPYSKMTFWDKEVNSWMQWFVILVLALGYIAAPVVSARFFQVRFLWLQWIAAYTSVAVGSVGVLVFAFAPPDIFEDLIESQITPRAAAIFNAPGGVFIVGLIVGTYWVRKGHLSFSSASLITVATAGTCGVLVLFFSLVVIVRGTFGFLGRQKDSCRPDVRLFQHLLNLLPLYDYEFASLGSAQKILQRLEKIASLLEGEFARKFESDDPITDGWIEQEMKERAAAVREMKKMVIYSKGHLPPELAERSKSMLIHVCNLDWQALDKAPTKDPTKLERAKQLKQRVMRATGVSAVPLVLLLLVIFVKPIRELDSSHALFAGAILFLAISVLSALDPDFAKTGIDLLSKVVGGKLKGSE